MSLYAFRQSLAAGLDRVFPPPPWGSRAIVSIEGRDQTPLAAWCPVNILADTIPPLPAADFPPHIVVPSGWFSEDVRPLSDSEVYPEDPRTWMGEGRARLDEIAPRLADQCARRGARLALTTHARQVLADPHACNAFLTTHEHAPIDIALDPVAMLTANMLALAEDHLRRICDAMLDQRRVCMVLLHNLTTLPGRPADDLAPSPIHEGLLDPDLLVEIARRAADAGRPVVLRETQLGRQLGLLRPARMPATR